jgi:hypothetical protein
VLKGLESFIALLFMIATSTTFAVHINHDRTGQVALLPYYTVNNNFITNFTVVNTSGVFKAVRVRLLDSQIGADLLNLNLYLSPYDVWEVNDYPHDGDGALCTNAGYVDNATPDVEIGIIYYSYEEETAVEDPYDDCGFTVCPVMPPLVIALERKVNVITANRAAGGNQSVLGTPAANSFDWTLETEFEAGWVTILTGNQYDYETNPSITAMTELTGGISAEIGTWTGVPVIGFSAMAADIGPAQVGETVELIRSVNRSN